MQENHRRLSASSLTEGEIDTFDYSSWAELDQDPKTLANWSPYPKDWVYGSEHYQLARKMKSEDAQWLASLPLTIHIRPLHTYIVHAGLLPWTVPRSGIKSLTTSESTLEDVEAESWIPPSLLASLRPDRYIPLTKKVSSYLLNSFEHSVLLVKQNRDPYSA